MNNNLILKKKAKKNSVLFIILTLVAILLFFLDLIYGSVNIPINELIGALLNPDGTKKEWVLILFNFRLPKAITAVLVGAALSVSGLQMQTIFRNPLAGPYVLGISAGAGLGVAILLLGLNVFVNSILINTLGNWAMATAAWSGSALILVVIMLVSARVKDIMTILILGIMFGSAISAIVTILQYFSNAVMLKTFVLWTMGSLGGVTPSQLKVLIPAVLLGLLLTFFSMKLLNAMLLGEDYAKNIGVNIKTARFIVFISTSLLAGTITAFCGPIGFIGIAVPHICRILFQTANHKILFPATVLVGAICMLVSDIVSQLSGQQSTLPINSVTALIGVPVIIWVIIKNQKLIKV